MPTKAELEQDLAVVRRRLREEADEFEKFKKRVVETAVQVAGEQGWCDDGLRETLAELGLEPPRTQVSGTVTMTFAFSGSTLNSSKTNTEMQEFIQDSLQIIEPGLDEDWEDVDFETDAVRVTVHGMMLEDA